MFNNIKILKSQAFFFLIGSNFWNYKQSWSIKLSLMLFIQKDCSLEADGYGSQWSEL